MDKAVKENPFVSVLMPVYNGEKYLSEAIESILTQTYTNFEFLIINDGSTDNTVEIIDSFNDPRILLVNNTHNLKLIATLNKGVTLCKGKYIVRMDADDISLPTRIEEQVRFMEMNPNVGICGSYVEEFGIDPKIIKYPISHDEIFVSLLFYSSISHPASIWRRSIFTDYDLKFHDDFIQAEDYKFWTDVARFTKLHNLPRILLKYRKHEQQDGFSKPLTNYNKSVSRIKQELLSQLIYLTKQEESEEAQNILSGKPNYNGNTIRVITKVCDANKSKFIFNQLLLERMLANYWKNSYLQKTKISFNELILLFTKHTSTISKFTFKQYLYIITKFRLNV